MAKKAYETLTETMLYVLMSFQRGDMCGTEIADHVRQLTNGRVRIGPGTLYTILSNFQKEGFIQKKESQGRTITYSITPEGLLIYLDEIQRLNQCLEDASKEARQ